MLVYLSFCLYSSCFFQKPFIYGEFQKRPFPHSLLCLTMSRKHLLTWLFFGSLHSKHFWSILSEKKMYQFWFFTLLIVCNYIINTLQESVSMCFFCKSKCYFLPQQLEKQWTRNWTVGRIQAQLYISIKGKLI